MSLVFALDQALLENLQGVDVLGLDFPHQEHLSVQTLAQHRQQVEVVNRVLFIHSIVLIIIGRCALTLIYNYVHPPT